MRPKKKILLAGSADERLSVLQFTLETWGFAVTRVDTEAQAVEQIEAQRYELLLCDLPFGDIDNLLRQAYEIDPELRTMVLTDKSPKMPSGLCAHAVVPRDCPGAELLERVWLLTARRRGPRKVAAASVTNEQERRIA